MKITDNTLVRKLGPHFVINNTKVTFSFDGARHEGNILFIKNEERIFIQQDCISAPAPLTIKHQKNTFKHVYSIFNPKRANAAPFTALKIVPNQPLEFTRLIIKAEGEILLVSYAKNKEGIPTLRDIKRMFRIMPHPDCCGAKLLFGFSSTSLCNSNYNPYAQLTATELDFIKNELADRFNFIAHLAYWQKPAIKFIESLGFIKAYSFINKNYKDNLIHVYTNRKL